MKKLFFLFLAVPLLTEAQPMLTAEDAVAVALRTNYDILVANEQASADSVMNTWGEAGALPSVYLNAGTGFTQNHLNQRYTNGNEVSSDHAGGTTMNAGVALSWTLFDGTKMFVTKQKLEQVEMQGDYLFRMQVLNTTSDVLVAYYDLVKQKQQLAATDEIMAYNLERVKITEARFNSGLGAKTDLLQAKIDLNFQKENKLALELNYTNAKHQLNLLLGRDILTDFDVSDSVPLAPIADRAQLESKMYQSNPGLLAMQTQLNVANFAYRETRTQYFPRLVGTAGYNFNRSQNSAGFTLYNQAYGWNAGLTLSMPLYLGGSLKRQSQMARINIATADYQLQRYSAQVRIALHDALDQYDMSYASVQLELENEILARENMELALERLRLGEGTALEVAQAQTTLSTVLFRLAGLRNDVKTAEINVHRQAADA